MTPELLHPTDKHSIWSETTQLPGFPALTESIHADVCIVGGGIAGLSTAYELMRAGKKVVVLEGGALAGGMTQVTSAHLSNVLEKRYSLIEQFHGQEGARLAAQSHAAAIDQIEQIVAREHIECDFERVDGYLFAPQGQESTELARELETAQRIRVAAYLQGSAPLPFDTGSCLHFPNQAQFHPLRYLVGIIAALQQGGVRIYEHSRVGSVESATPAKVIAEKGDVTAEHVVVATNAPINDLLTMHTKQAAYTTYVVGARVPRASVMKALFWDTEDPFHYVRIHEMHDSAGESDLLLVGGEDHRTGQEPDTLPRYSHLERWARDRFPMIEKFAFEWSGQVLESIDGLAYIGRNPMDREHTYIATGDCGSGITHGVIASMLLNDLIEGHENPWAELYSPSRITLRAAGNYARENLKTAMQYGDWLTSGDVDSTRDIEPGSGAILRRGMSKVAVYRDEQGALHETSAVCTHLGGIVHWNDTEKTWDCPCHGARYDKFGAVMSGPAISNLALLPAVEDLPKGHHPGL